MPISSTDFPVGIGGESNDVFAGQGPDDMQDVPLTHSVTPAAAKSIQSASSLPQPKAVLSATQAPTPSPKLHFPPNFASPSKSSALTVRVHTPETVSQTTMGIPITHTVYQVETKSTLNAFPKAQCAVKRRFSDFDALYTALRNRYPGYFIPILPDKTILQGKLLSDKIFLEKRTQDLELFVNECCQHEVLQLFLTLEAEAVPSHPQWKRAEDEQCAFHSIAMLRKTPVALMAHDSLPSTAPPSSTIGKLSSSLFSGVSYITGKVKDQIVPTAPAAENVVSSPMSIDAAQRGDTLVKRCCGVDGLLLRWSQVAQSLHFAGIGAQDLAADFHRLWKYEEAARVHVNLPASAQQVGTQYKRVSYNVAHVGKGIETHAKSAEAAFSPLRVVASGMHAGKRALEDRNELRAGIAEAQTAVQEKREKYRVFGPEAAGGNVARSTGLEEVQRAITALDARISEMQSDYGEMCDVHKSEVKKLEAKATQMVPSAVFQVATLMEGLADSTAQQWEALAQSLGADIGR